MLSISGAAPELLLMPRVSATVGVFTLQFLGGPRPFFSNCSPINSWIVHTYDAMMNTVNYNASIEP
jgi:hypothetical protein